MLRKLLTFWGKVFVEVSVFLLCCFSLLNMVFPFSIEKDYSKVFYDQKGEIIFATLSKDDKWRFELREDELSDELKTLLLAKEDKHFEHHFGVNPASVFRAMVKNLMKRKTTSGASTITMQLARLLEPKKRSYANKITEVFRAFQLETRYNKAFILKSYLEKLPYGGNVEGISTASHMFYGTSLQKLNHSEAISLIIVPNRPNSLSLRNKSPEALNEAVGMWKKRFQKSGIFSKDEELNQQPNPNWRPFPKLIPHLSRKLLRDDKKQNIFKTFIDSETQKTIQELTTNYVSNTKRLSVHNAAVLVVENKNSNVVCYVGSQDFNDNENEGQIDGVNAIRSPGSTLKPLLYGLAIDQGLVTPQTVLMDVPLDFNGYSPENFDKKFRGQVSASKALQTSLNVPAVDLLDKLGVDLFAGFLSKAGLKTVEKKKKELGLSLILGGCGVTLEEMTNLYTSLPNKGKIARLNFYTSENLPKKEPLVLISDASAYMIAEILSGISRPEFDDYSSFLENHQNICWKTGTSYGRRDAWCMGFSKHYTVGVWLGNFNNSPSPELVGLELAAPLFFQIMNHLGKGKTADWFEAPEILKTRIVCAESGLPPNETCVQLVSDYFIPAVSAYHTCNHTKKYWVDEFEKLAYCSNCLPLSGFKQKEYRNLHPLLLDFYLSNRLNIDLPPPHNPSCKQELQTESLNIISPKNNVVYYIDKKEPEKFQLSCAASAFTKKVFWFVNGKKSSENKPNEKPFVYLEMGKNTIDCIDEHGNKASVLVEVKFTK